MNAAGAAEGTLVGQLLDEGANEPDLEVRCLAFRLAVELQGDELFGLLDRLTKLRGSLLDLERADLPGSFAGGMLAAIEPGLAAVALALELQSAAWLRDHAGEDRGAAA